MIRLTEALVEKTSTVRVAAYQKTADPLFELFTRCINQNAQLDERRDPLLPKLLSGHVRVSEATHFRAVVA